MHSQDPFSIKQKRGPVSVLVAVELVCGAALVIFVYYAKGWL